MTTANKSIVLAWFEAFNTHNLEQLLQLYHDQAEHYSPKLKIRQPETNGLIKGKAAPLWRKRPLVPLNYP